MSGVGTCSRCGRPRRRLAWRLAGPARPEELADPAAWGWMLTCPAHLEAWEVDSQSDPPSQRIIDKAIREHYYQQSD